MRSTNLAVLALASGCALVDASGAEHGPPIAGESYTTVNLSASMTPKSAAVAELDGSPGPDVAVITDQGQLEAYSQMGTSGQFVHNSSDVMGCTFVVAAELDGDLTRDELVVGGLGKLEVLVQSGSITSYTHHPLTVDPSFQPRAIAAFRGPSGTIVAAADMGSNKVYIFRDVLGTPMASPLTMDQIPNSVVIADVDPNGAGPEIIVANGNHLIVVGLPPIDTAVSVDLPQGIQVKFLAVGHFGGDGFDDIAHSEVSPGPGEIGFSFGTPSGLLHGTKFTGNGLNADGLLAADLNGDGSSDLVGVTTDNDSKRQLDFFLQSPPNPGSQDPRFVESSLTVQARAVSIATGDLNGDGHADFLLVPAQTGGIDVMISK